jgi:hypothetical protein
LTEQAEACTDMLLLACSTSSVSVQSLNSSPRKPERAQVLFSMYVWCGLAHVWQIECQARQGSVCCQPTDRQTTDHLLCLQAVVVAGILGKQLKGARCNAEHSFACCIATGKLSSSVCEPFILFPYTHMFLLRCSTGTFCAADVHQVAGRSLLMLPFRDTPPPSSAGPLCAH